MIWSRGFRSVFFWVSLLTMAALAGCQPAPTPPTLMPTAIVPTAVPATTAPTPSPTPAPQVNASNVDPSQRASVRFLNAVNGSEPVDVRLETTTVTSRLAFGRLTSPVPVIASTFAMSVRPSAQPDSPALYAEQQSFGAGQSLLFVFTGARDRFSLLRIEDDVSPLRKGETRVKVVLGAAPDVSTAPITVQFGATRLGDLRAGGEAIARTIATAEYDLQLIREGQTVTRQGIRLQGNRSYTLVVLPGPGDTLILVTSFVNTVRESLLRLVHAGPPLPAYDVYLGKTLLKANFVFRDVTEWQPLRPTSYQIRLFAPGASPDNEPLFRSAVSLSPDQASTVVLYNGALPDAVAAPQLLSFAEDLSPTAPGEARLTFVHLAPTQLSITVVQTSAVFLNLPPVARLKQSQPLALSVRTLSSIGLLARDPRNPTVETTIEAPDPFELQAGFNYVYLITGSPESRTPLLLRTDVGIGSGAAAIVAVPSPLEMRFINALGEALGVDVYIDEQLLVSGLPVGRLASAQSIPETAQQVRVTRAGTTDLLTGRAFTFRSGGLYTFILVGSSSAPELLQAEEDREPGVGRIWLRFINALPGESGVTINLLPPRATPTPGTGLVPQQFIRNVGYPGVSALSELRVGVYTFSAVRDADSMVLAELPNIDVRLGVRYDLLLIPDATAGVRLILLTDQR